MGFNYNDYIPFIKYELMKNLTGIEKERVEKLRWIFYKEGKLTEIQKELYELYFFQGIKCKITLARKMGKGTMSVAQHIGAVHKKYSEWLELNAVLKRDIDNE